MANRYANLVGANKIKDEYTKINEGFDAIQADMDQKADKAFTQVNGMQAETKDDALTIAAGTGIAVTENPNTKTVIITAMGTATPGPHGSAHTEFGADPIPFATPTEGGLMSAEDKTALEFSHLNVSKTISKMFGGDATKIVCYGDSVTYGYQAGTGSQVTDPYPAVLQNRLRTIYNNNSIDVVNMGTSGWRTVEALQNIQSVINQNPDLVIVMFGINDVRGVSGGTSFDDYKSNLDEIVKILIGEGIEVLLLTPTPIIDTTNDYHKELVVYARAVQEVAVKYKIGFVDMHHEISRMFLSRELYPLDFLADTVHPADANYKTIADVIAAKLLQYNNSTQVLFVDTREDYSVPIYASPYIDHNLTSTFDNPNVPQVYKRNYIMPAGSNGLFLRFNFFVTVPGMSLILRHAKNTFGGLIVVEDNGQSVATVDFFAPGSHAYNTETVLVENLSLGWHSILFDQSNLSLGQATSGNGNAYLSEFVFRPKDTAIDDFTYINQASVSLPELENFQSVTNGTVRLTSTTDTGQKGAILFSGGSVQLKPGKKLVIEAEGKFFAGSGITWFGNKMQDNTGTVLSGVLTGYILFLTASSIQLYSCGSGNAIGTAIASVSDSLDYNSPHLIRIEHGDDGSIKVQIDGVDKINVANTQHNAGFFGLWTFNTGTVELSRFEYCYI